MVPILADKDEFFDYLNGVRGADFSGKNTAVPDNFEQWIADNHDSIKNSKTIPCFIKNNKKFIGEIINTASREFIMTRSAMEILKRRKFTFSDGDDFIAQYNSSAMKRFDIIQFDADLTSLLSAHKIKIYEKKLSWNSSGLTNMFGQNGLTKLELKYKGTKEDEIFAMTRVFNFDGDVLSVSHELLILPASIRSKGVAKKILNLLYRYYRKIGVERIELYANLDIGGYSWAKFGFNTTRRNAEFVIGRAQRNDVISLQEYLDAERIINSHFRKNEYSQVFPMRLLAQESYGKRMLLGSNWDGFLDLTDKGQLEILLKYLR
jgi:hypothetical protein